MNRFLIIGYGYLGRQVARLASFSGNEVFATTRSTEKFAEIKASGCQPIAFDWNNPGDVNGLPEVDQVLVAVSYDRKSGVDRYTSMVGGLSRLLAALKPGTGLCYISTTGVYHQTGHVWVDENSTTRPRRDGGKAHLRAEALLNRQYRQHSMILRLSGIYGPGRIPRAADVRAGRLIASPSEGYLNLIHVDDAASVVMAAWNRIPQLLPGDRRLYVVSDDGPIVRRDFYRQIADYYRVAEPSFVKPTDDSAVQFRSESSKRVWNRRMKRDLLKQLAFPSSKAGLCDALSG